EPLTRELSMRESEGLIRNAIDERITKIRPMSTPIDQLSRWAGARRADSMVVDYYSVDIKPTKATVSMAYTEPTTSTVTSASQKVTINTSNNDIFEVSETILVQGIKGYDGDGTTRSKSDLVLYITSKEENGTLNVYAINGKKIGAVENCVPSVQAGTTLIRMGRAATELDVQTAQFEALPVKEQNNCQIFKIQVEQSTFQKIAAKNVPWDFSDSEESAIYDMRLGMEKTFMFGVKRTLYDSRKKENVALTGGIWWQAGKEYEFDPSKDLMQDDLIDIMKEAFTGNGGNKRKVLVGGSDFIGRINKLEVTKVITADDEFVKWGIDFTEIRSKFGKFYVLYSEVFDDCGMGDYGFVFDPEFVTRWAHVPFGHQKLDLKSAGIRNTDAVVMTEASCLTLRYPAAHMRIIPKASVSGI
ncbi:MAG: Ig-like domain-containing protein, partial [Bacteroidales bacterium]